MGKVIAKKIRGMNLWAKVALTVLLTVALSVFMYEGWFTPHKTSATPTISNAWTNVYAAAASTVSIDVDSTAFAVNAGTNRLLLVAVQYEIGSSGTFSSQTVTYGGVALTPIATTGATSGRSHSWLGYLKDAQIPAGSNSVNVVATNSQSLQGVQIAVASYTGVNQTTPITDFAQSATATASVAFPSAIDFAADSVTVFCASNGGSAATMTLPAGTGGTTFSTQSGASSTGGGFSGFVAASGTNASAGSYTTANTVSFGGTSSTRSSLVVASLNPAVSIVNPTVTSTSPNNMRQGTGPTTVTITGTGFKSGAAVSFSGTGITTGAVTFVNSTTITVPVTVAAGATTGARNVTVTNTDTGTGTGTGVFTVNPAIVNPTVVSTSPSSMTQGTGPTTVTITGTGFQSGATVAFSGTGVTTGTVTVVNATTITVPVTVAAGATTGARNVTVTNTDTGTGTGTGIFTVNAAVVNPTVVSASPNNMTQGTGPTTVTITGTGFQSGATVAFSGTGVTTGTVTVVNATTITVPVTVAAGATTGARNVTVTNTDTGTGTGTGIFTVNAAIVNPTVTSTSPNNMTQGTGPTTVTITGTGFLSGATVTFSGTGITTGAVTVASATTITVPVTVAAGATTGARNVTVTNTNTGTGTGTGIFTVNAAASCTTGAQLLTITPNATIQPGGLNIYTVTVSNGDSGGSCTNRAYTLTRGAPSNSSDFVTSALSKTALSVPPGGTDSATFTVTANAAAANGVTSATSVSTTGTTPTSVTATTTVSTFASPLMHNGANLGTKYSGGTWGSTFTCTTCHATTTSNVKRVATQVSTPQGVRTVVFTRMTASSTSTNGVFGDDQRTYAVNASTNICEVCHHQTTFHQYSSTKVTDKTHYNRKDCTSCHPHSVGFKGAGCDGCHGNPPTSLATLVYSPEATLALGNPPTSAGAHAVHVTTESMGCNTCHSGNTMPTVSKTIQMGFDVNPTNWPGFNGTAAFGTFSGHSPLGGTAPAYTFVASKSGTSVNVTAAYRNSCNVYCHGNWSGSNGSTNPSWTGGPSNAACGTCHGASSSLPPLSGSHQQHAAASPAGYGFSCTKCHPNVASGTFSHIDGSVQWRLSSSTTGLIGPTATYRGVISSTAGTGTLAGTTPYGDCANIYCHSNGLATSPTYVTSLTWGNAAEGNCGTCHGVLAGTPPASATHARHVGSAAGQYKYSCSKCHSTVVSATTDSTTAPTITSTTLHVNKAFDLAYDSFNTGATSCQTTYCHSEGTGATGQTGDARPVDQPVTAPTWTSAANCSMCHTGGTTTGPTYVNGTPKANSHDSHTKAGVAYTCDVCHYATTTSGTAITDATKHVNKVYDVSANTAKTAAFIYAYNSTGGTCDNSSCHGAGVPKWGSNTTTAQCQKCHGSTATAFATVSSAQVAPGYSTDGKDTGGNVAATSARVGTHQGHLAAATGISAPIRCSECHVKVNAVTDAGHLNYTTATVTFSGRATAQSHTTASVSRVSGVIQCNNTYCHTGKLNTGLAMTPAFNNTTYLSTSLTMTDCTRCHAMPPNPGVAGTHQSIASALTGFPATSCGCHTNLSSTGTTFANIFVDKKLHINGIIEGGDCVSCHGSVQNVVRRIVTGPSGDFVKTSHHVTNGTTTQIVNVNACIVCHGDLLASRSHPNGLPADPQVDLVDPDTGAFVANTAAGVEQVCSKCHDANGATRAGLPSGSTATQPFNTAGDNRTPSNLNWTAGAMAHSANNGCLNCHDNGHGNANALMTRFVYTATDTVATATNFCYNCHGTTVANGAVDAIKASFDTAYGHNTIKCQDCHDQHQAKAYSNTKGSGTLNPVLNGVPGKSATWSAASTWPSTSNATYTTNTASAEWHICFKCHAGTGFVTGGTGAASMTDLGLEFNTNNQSYHPVAAALPATGNRRLGATYVTGGWTPGMVMNCSDCHGNNTGASRGPHGSSVKWMLNPNTTGTKYYNWPYTTAAGNGTSTGTLVMSPGNSTGPTGGVFCLSCHAWSGGGAGHTRGDHSNISCVGCHIRVPHGGKMPRLLTSVNAPARYKPDGNGGGTVYLDGVNRPASGTFGSSNCNGGGGCTTHSGTMTYAW